MTMIFNNHETSPAFLFYCNSLMCDRFSTHSPRWHHLLKPHSVPSAHGIAFDRRSSPSLLEWHHIFSQKFWKYSFYIYVYTNYKWLVFHHEKTKKIMQILYILIIKVRSDCCIGRLQSKSQLTLPCGLKEFIIQRKRWQLVDIRTI